MIKLLFLQKSLVIYIFECACTFDGILSDYKRYAGQIRQEYIHIPDNEFKSKRAQVVVTQKIIIKDQLGRKRISKFISK